MAQRSAETRLQTRLERLARRRTAMPAPQVLVRAPGRGFEFGELTAPFHSASVGKLMTATLLTVLIELGYLGFDTPIGKLLPAADLAGLPSAPGVDIRTDVTVEHLLTHTSGLPDFFEPPRGSETACSIRTLATQRDRRWTPAALLAEVRGLPAVGRPGERFCYTDTGYVLLGRIAEESAGDRFDALLREHVLAPSAMERSSTPYSAARAPEDLAELEVAPFWIGRDELSRALSMSIDWAGGGIVTVPEDLVRFQRALYSGQLISHRYREHLARPRRRMRRGIHYGAGTMTVRFGEFLPPLMRGLPEPVGHVGIFATHMFYYPRHDAHVVLNFHSTRQMNQSFSTHANIARLIASWD